MVTEDADMGGAGLSCYFFGGNGKMIVSEGVGCFFLPFVFVFFEFVAFLLYP